MEEMAGESPILGNSRLVLFIVLLLFYSCDDHNQKKDEDTLESNFKKEDTLLSANLKDTVKYRELLLPDSTINNKLRLENYLSAEAFSKNKIELIDLLRESPVAIFCNKDKSEYILAYQYEGNTKNAFSCFEIGYTDDKILRNKCDVTEEENFSTESGIKLGMPLESLIAKKGSSFKMSGQDTVITYRINDLSSNFLRRYNMPGYFLECSIKNAKIIKIKFGFDYP